MSDSQRSNEFFKARRVNVDDPYADALEFEVTRLRLENERLTKLVFDTKAELGRLKMGIIGLL